MRGGDSSDHDLVSHVPEITFESAMLLPRKHEGYGTIGVLLKSFGQLFALSTSKCMHGAVLSL